MATPGFGSNSAFGVSPLPAFPGSRNPVDLAPGQSVPHHDNFTSSTIGSNVTLDQDSYERAAANTSAGNLSSIPETGIFGVPPVTSHMIPESSLPMGAGLRDYGSDAGTTFQSAGAGNSTAELAGQVSREPRGVPEVVQESLSTAHQSPEAASSPEAVSDKQQLEQELLSKVPPQDGVSTSAQDFTSGGYVPQTVQKSQQLAQQDPEAAGNPAAVSDKQALESELLQRVPKEDATSAGGSVPQTVTESQQLAQQSPEAAANSQAVRDKQALESELLQRVPREDAIGSSSTFSGTAADASGKVGEYAAAGAAAVGLTGVAAALSGQSHESSLTGSAVPQSVQNAAYSTQSSLSNGTNQAQNTTRDTAYQAQNTASEYATSAQNTASEYATSAQNTASSYTTQAQNTASDYATSAQSTLNQTAAQAQNTARDTTAKAQSALSQATATVPHSFQEAASFLPASVLSVVDKASNAVGHLTGANATADNVPLPVQHSVEQQISRGPEAAAYPKSVSEKAAVEQELLRSIRPAQESGEPAPHYSAPPPTSSQSGLGTSVPEPVQHSFAESSRGAEAAANPQAVSEKSAVEQELLQSVPTTQESGESAPQSSTITSSATDAAKSATEYAKSTANNASEYATSTANNASEYARSTVNNASEYANNTATDASNKIGEYMPNSATDASNKVGEYAAVGASALGLGGVAAAMGAQSHSNASNSSRGLSSAVPEPVQHSIAEDSVRGPEAALNETAVLDKAAVENELLSSVRPTNESGEPAPSQTAALSASGPGMSSSSSGFAAPRESSRTGLGEGLASPQIYDNDTAPALLAMNRDLHFSERPSNTNSAYESQTSSYTQPPSQYSAPSTQYSQPATLYSAPSTQHSAPPTQYSGATSSYAPETTRGSGYSSHQQSVIDRVFGASIDSGDAPSYTSSAAPIATGVSLGAAGGIAAGEMTREVEQPQGAEQYQAPEPIAETPLSSKPLSSYTHVQNETYGGSSLAFQNDPVGAQSGSAPSVASQADPRGVASAFANDPISPALARSATQSAATTSVPLPQSTATDYPVRQSSRSAASNPALLAATAAATTGSAGILAAESARSDRGLNASSANAAQTPATKIAQPTGGALASALQENQQVSRDVSPMNRGSVSQPTVTSGVSSQTIPSKSQPQTQTSQTTPAKSTTLSSSASPSKAPPASGPRLDIPGSGSSDTKTKRRSFFGKMKDRMSGHK